MSGSNYSDPPHKNKNLKKKHFVVKVQVPIEFKSGSINPEGDLCIYNMDKSFNTILPKKSNEVLPSRLREKITSEGYGGLKGYFHVIIEAGDKEANQFRINPEHVTIEAW